MLLAGCGSTFRISYDTPIEPAVSRGWTVTEVRVTVPDELEVSEQKSIFPQADIVWREDPEGDRKAQVAAIIRDAASEAAAPLNGPRAVAIDITLQRFHALTFEAERRLEDAGVHNTIFTASVVDAASGAILVGPTEIHADAAAFSGPKAVEYRRQGATQKDVITTAIRRTIAGWLGVGPDPRGEFNRIGG
ncbi:DUF6778 family protein [Ostreiculturibacter nitratireducens]|uniref:DUF6778 family protein n=1 Tax=Ostreiculturibacter nitratireducens TaxID=3075226 RepID=UPI0031B60C65